MGSDLKISAKIQEYILNNGLDLHPVQKEIISYNESLGDIKRMQISISQSQFLHLIVKTSNVKKILEIGTFTGLSALSMSLALPEDGRIIALDKNQKTNEIAIKFFEKAKQNHKIQTIIKPALESLSEIKENDFDLIFIDADKKNYKNYFDQVIHKLNKGGIIIVDNVLWKGKVTDLSKNQNDKIAVYMNDFNEYIKKNKKVSKLILPVRDGLTLIIKDEN